MPLYDDCVMHIKGPRLAAILQTKLPHNKVAVHQIDLLLHEYVDRFELGLK